MKYLHTFIALISKPVSYRNKNAQAELGRFRTIKQNTLITYDQYFLVHS